MNTFYGPYIADDSFEPALFAGDDYVGQLQEGSSAKSGPLLSMSAYEKVSQRDMLGYRHDSGNYVNYADGSLHPIYYDPGMPSLDQDQELDYLSDDTLNTPGQEKVPLMITHGRQPSNASYTEASFKPEQGHANMLKRKRNSSQYDVAPPSKKPAGIQLQGDSGYYDVSEQTSPYSSMIPTPNSTTTFNAPPSVMASGRPSGHHYSTSNVSQMSLAAPSPHTPATWSPSFATVRTEPSPPAPRTPAPRPATASPLRSSAPKLVRTSTIQQPSPSANGAVMAASFNPYAMYPLKASLKLKGDLDAMTKGWTEKEIDARRRLVEFRRSQDGNTITAEYNPVAPEDRSPSSIVISCILWKEKKEYYVTSVDTIYLLEALVGVRFTVEEKNRIRRNLEGFRPATVSKSKLDSEEFFKVIMGFPHPKPRNIEKDVKVFPWKILKTALSKIIGKYSASYSSTASALLTPVPSNFPSDGPAVYEYDVSPHQEYSAPLAPYPVSHDHFYPTAPVSGRMSAPVTTAPIPELQLQVPTAGPAFDFNDPLAFAAMPGMPHNTMVMNTEAMSAPIQKAPTWDFNQYMHAQASAPPQSAPPMAYHRGAIETVDFEPANGYFMR